MTTLRTSPDTFILAFPSDRTQATAPAIQAACRMTPGEVRARLVMLESMRLVAGRQDKDAPPRKPRHFAKAVRGFSCVER